MKNLAGVFADSARKTPEKIAISWGDADYSYRHILSQTLRLAEWLKSEYQIKPGDRVGVWLKNCPQFVPALFGVLQVGAVVVPINNFLKPDEVSFILEDAGIDLLITEHAMAHGVTALRLKRPELKTFRIEQFSELDAGRHAHIDLMHPGTPERGDDDLAIIIYTSGTTGFPKGAMLSHSNLLQNVASCQIVLETVAEDRIGVLLPMFHSFMLTVGILLPMLSNGSIIIVKSLHPAKAIVEELIARQVTVLPAVPPFFRALSHPSVPLELPIRLCISGGAPLPPDILRDFSRKYINIPLIEGYGLSEASPVVSVNPIHGEKRAGSIGLPIAGVEVSVQNEAGEILGPEETGEICVRGANVMLGYWNQPKASAETMRNGWLLTGDIGRRDPDGYFYITDRKKDMILVNGINVYPRQIEEVICQFDGVREAAVIGVPDTRRGEQPVAFIAPQEGASIDQNALLHFVRERLADYKVPRQVRILSGLPRNSTGKVLKTELRKLHDQPVMA